MALTDYTDNATIRALLGVNELELEDSVLALPSQVLAIEEGYDALSLLLMPMYETVKAIDAGSRTKQQKRFYDQAQLYAAFLVARAVGPTLPMFAPKRIEDSKAQMERVNDPYTKLWENLLNTLASLGARLLTTLAILDPAVSATPVARRYAASAGLVSDPVTGV